MISKVRGDILLSDARAIAHGVAPHDHFKQGLALALRELHPAMVKDFRHYCREQNPKAGEAWLWAGPERVVINLMTQEPAPSEGAHPGEATEHNVSSALKQLRRIIEAENIPSLALPRLATGVGKLDWSVVEPLIEQHLGDLTIPIIIYETFSSGVKAREGLKSIKVAQNRGGR